MFFIISLGAMVQYRQARPWIHHDLLFALFGHKSKHDKLVKILHEFAYDAINKRRAEFEMNKKLQNTKENDDDDIGKKNIFLLFAHRLKIIFFHHFTKY